MKTVLFVLATFTFLCSMAQAQGEQKSVEHYVLRGSAAHAYFVMYDDCVETSVRVGVDEFRRPPSALVAYAWTDVMNYNLCNDTILSQASAANEITASEYSFAKQLSSARVVAQLHGTSYDIHGLPSPAILMVDVTITATDPFTRDRWSDVYQNKCATSRYRYDGRRRLAVATGSVYLDGVEMLSEGVQGDADLVQLRSGSLYRVVKDCSY